MRYYLRGIIISSLILLLACSANHLKEKVGQTQKKADQKLNNNKKKSSNIKRKQNKKEKKRPCWMIETDPNKCEEYKEESAVYLFFATSMSKKLTNSNITDSNKEDLLKHLRGEYASMIKSKVTSIVKDKITCKKQGEEKSCEEEFYEKINIISEAHINPEEIKLRDYFIKNLDVNKQELYGLGCVLKTQ
ncbi:secreted protein [Candidatus Magnetomorum sp. HK-1]|nr:secreted protein [Candidatus Magnetomorum sp. HK-1]